jgi:hypothetical protein
MATIFLNTIKKRGGKLNRGGQGRMRENKVKVNYDRNSNKNMNNKNNKVIGEAGRRVGEEEGNGFAASARSAPPCNDSGEIAALLVGESCRPPVARNDHLNSVIARARLEARERVLRTISPFRVCGAAGWEPEKRGYPPLPPGWGGGWLLHVAALHGLPKKL